MPLNDLSYDELCALRRMTEMLVEAHPSLRHLGPVHFDLTPGADVMIRIEVCVPDLSGALVAQENDVDDFRLAERTNFDAFKRRLVDIFTLTAPTLSEIQAGLDETELAADHEHEPTTPDSRSQADVAHSSLDATADVTGVAAGDGGVAVAAACAPVADIPVVAPEPVATIETAAFPPKPAPLPNPWTAAEDDALVQGVVERMLTGLAMHRAAGATAQQLGRPVEGTVWRCKNKLKERIEGALAAAKRKPAPELVATPAPGVDTDLAQHLQELRRKGSWTIAEDVEMLKLMALGWGLQDISVEMKLDGAELKRRWDALSDLHEADEGRKLRSWTAKQLLPVLQALQAGKAA